MAVSTAQLPEVGQHAAKHKLLDFLLAFVGSIETAFKDAVQVIIQQLIYAKILPPRTVAE